MTETQIIKGVKIKAINERKTKDGSKTYWMLDSDQGGLSVWDGGLSDLVKAKCLGKTCDIGIIQKGAYMNLDSIEKIYGGEMATADQFHKAMQEPIKTAKALDDTQINIILQNLLARVIELTISSMNYAAAKNSLMEIDQAIELNHKIVLNEFKAIKDDLIREFTK